MNSLLCLTGCIAALSTTLFTTHADNSTAEAVGVIHSCSTTNEVALRSAAAIGYYGPATLVTQCYFVGPLRGSAARWRGMRTRVALTDPRSGAVLWSFWPSIRPHAYDFTLGTHAGEPLCVFAADYSIGVFRGLDMRDSPVPQSEHDVEGQPIPELVDLLTFLPKSAFAPDDGKTGNALTAANLRVLSVHYSNGWHILIKGHGGLQYDLYREGEEWKLNWR